MPGFRHVDFRTVVVVSWVLRLNGEDFHSSSLSLCTAYRRYQMKLKLITLLCKALHGICKVRLFGLHPDYPRCLCRWDPAVSRFGWQAAEVADRFVGESRPYQTHVDRQRDAKARTERPTWVFWSEADCHFIHHYLSLLVSVSLRNVPVPILIELIN